ncbi:MAG: SpoIIE family protein phosphatase, partial [Armatimonadetes bacterium]|nr:SpoIIE family protein phosphatase [Armatimonadota bacterium]
ILVVDDAPEIRTVLRGLLEGQSHQVLTAETGADAERFLSAGEVDLILLDLDLPDTTGIDFCRSLRDEGCDVPILMLTRHDTVRERMQGLECGADDYLGKPFDPGELIARVHAQLRRRTMEVERVESLLRQKWQSIHDGLQLAQKIQQPFGNICLSSVQASVRYFPVGRVGGDFYLLQDLDGDRAVILIGDSMGKGVGASLLMASALSLLTDLVRRLDSPAEVMAEANRRLLPDLEDLGLFVSAFCGIWDRRHRSLRYSSAGHEPPIWLRRSYRGRRHGLLGTRGLVLGALSAASYEEKCVHPGPGDRLFLFTDGLTEAVPADRQPQLRRGIYRSLLETMDLSIEEQTSKLLDAIPRLGGEALILRDDLTFFMVEFEP